MLDTNGPKTRLTEQSAANLYDSGFWKQLLPYQRAVFQLCEGRLCMPFREFHAAVAHCLESEVLDISFATQYGAIKKAVLNGAPEPTDEELLAIIPEDFRGLIELEGGRAND